MVWLVLTSHHFPFPISRQHLSGPSLFWGLIQPLYLLLPAVSGQSGIHYHLSGLLVLCWRGHCGKHHLCATLHSHCVPGTNAVSSKAIEVQPRWLEHLQAWAQLPQRLSQRAIPAAGAMPRVQLLHGRGGQNPFPAFPRQATWAWAFSTSTQHRLVPNRHWEAPEALTGKRWHLLQEGADWDLFWGAGLGQLDHPPEDFQLLLLPWELLKPGVHSHTPGYPPVLRTCAREHEVVTLHHYLRRRILVQIWNAAQYHTWGVQLHLMHLVSFMQGGTHRVSQKSPFIGEINPF